MADDTDQLIIEISGRTDGFADSLKDAYGKASSAFASIEERGAKAATTLASLFLKPSSSLSLTLLTHGLQLAEADGSKLATTLLNVNRASSTLQKAAFGKVLQGELALIRKIQSSGGLKEYASTLKGSAADFGGIAKSAVFFGATAFAGFEALKFTLDEIVKAAAAAEAELASLVKIGDDAKNVGVGSSFFQQFTEGSKKLGLEAEDLTKILESLKDASTVSLGTGDDKNPQSVAQEAIAAEIQAGNLKKGDNKAFDGAETEEARLRAALALISELQQKGAQLAAFDLGKKLFGDDFETKLRGDSELVTKLQARLKDMAEGKGINVIPPEQIAAARELQAQIEDMNERIQNALVPFHNDLRAWQQGELQSTLQLKEYWVEIVEVFGRLWKWADQIGATISGWGNANIFKDAVQWMDQHGLMSEHVGAFHLNRDANGKITSASTGPDANQDSTDRPLTITRPKHDTSKPLPEAVKAPKAGKDDDPIENYLNELKKTTAAEQAEAQTLGMGNKAKQEALDLAKAKAIADEHDITLTAEQTREITAQADAYVTAKAKIEGFTKSQEQAKAQATFFGNEFESSIEKLVNGSGKLGAIFTDLTKAIEEAALKAALLGQGPLAGVFGSSASANGMPGGLIGGLFGSALGSFGRNTEAGPSGAFGAGGLPGASWLGSFAHLLGFAGGGEIAGPGTGTSDSILARVSHGEFVVNAKAAQDNLGLLHAINGGKMPKFATGGQVGAVSTPSFGGASSSRASGGVTLHNNVTVNANGGTPAANADLAKQVSDHVQAITRQTVISELRNQMRPGNILSR